MANKNLKKSSKIKNPRISVFLGSDSDLSKFEKAILMAGSFNIDCRVNIASAHRSPAFLVKLLKEEEAKGSELIIAGAGHAAHLAGVIASHTSLPVIGVPIDSSALNGMDSLLATVMMPSGIPVACMAIGEAGAKNAIVYSAQILGLKYPKVKTAFLTFRKGLLNSVKLKNAKLNKK